MIISIFDAGHMFRVHKRLGGQQAYIYFASLPVSKKDMLRANYLTCLLLTLLEHWSSVYMIVKQLIMNS